MFKVKLNLRKVIAIAICLAGVTMFWGCDKNDPNTEDNGNGNTTIADPVGTITANISESTGINIPNIGNIKWIKPDNFSLNGECYNYEWVSEPNNMGGYNSYWKYYHYNVSICNIGIVAGLGNITKIPSSGYTIPKPSSSEVAYETGRGYVIKFEGGNLTTPLYVRLYVVESIISTFGGVMGAKVKYQYPFEP